MATAPRVATPTPPRAAPVVATAQRHRADRVQGRVQARHVQREAAQLGAQTPEKRPTQRSHQQKKLVYFYMYPIYINLDIPKLYIYIYGIYITLDIPKIGHRTQFFMGLDPYDGSTCS